MLRVNREDKERCNAIVELIDDNGQPCIFRCNLPKDHIKEYMCGERKT